MLLKYWSLMEALLNLLDVFQCSQKICCEKLVVQTLLLSNLMPAQASIQALAAIPITQAPGISRLQQEST